MKNNAGATHESPLRRMAYRIPWRRSDWLAVGLITITVIVFFSPVLFGGFWLPNGGGDLVSFLWPTYSFASRTLQAGQLPLWNPHLYSGAPFWADNQSSVLYPPNLLVMLFTNVPYQSLEALVILHIWLAGLAMYTCLRNLTPSPPLQNREGGSVETGIAPVGAALGAIGWMLSDIFVTHIGNLNLIAAAAWIPLVVLGTWRSLRDLSWRWAILGGIAFGLGTLAGHAQMSLFTVMLIAAIFVWQFIGRLGKRTIPSLRQIDPFSTPDQQTNPLHIAALQMGLLALIAFLGLGLSAGGWLPAVEMTQYTARTELTYDYAAKYSLPPKALIGLVAPWVYGRGPAAFTGKWDRVEVGYVGVIVLLLAIAGAILSIRGRSTRSMGLFLTIMGVLGFLMALGSYFPLHRLAWEFVPGLRSVRAPARFVLFLNFAEAFLAALAFNQLITRRTFLNRLEISNFKFQISNVLWLVPLLAATELVAFGSTTEIDARDPRLGYDHPDAVAWLASQPDQPYRIDTAPARSWQPDSSARHGGPLYDIYGISNPLTLATTDTFYWAVGFRGSATYNALGVKYVLSDSGPPGDASLIPVKEFPDGLTAYLNIKALPMVLLVYHAVPVDSQPAAFERVHEPDWDARKVVFIEGGPALNADSASGGSLSYTAYAPNQIALRISTANPAYLVLSEAYYPGWVATIDEKPAPIYRANSSFRAIYLPTPGQHVIDLSFRPPLVFAGLGITTATFLILALLALNWIRGMFNRKDASEPKS